MEKAIARLERIVNNPFLLLFVSLILLATTGWDVAKTLFDDLSAHNIRAEHGLLLFALYSVVNALPHTLTAFSKLIQAHKEYNKKEAR